MNKSIITEIKRALRRHLRTIGATFNAYSYDVNEYDVNPHISCCAKSEDKKTDLEIRCYIGMDIEMEHYCSETGEHYLTTEH